MGVLTPRTGIGKIAEAGIRSPGRAAWAAIGLTWLVSAVLIGWGALQLRNQVRRQVVDRDAEVMFALSRPERESDAPDAGLPPVPMDTVNVFYSMARPKGILAARLYKADGEFQLSNPANVSESAIPDAAWGKLRAMHPASRFDAAYSMAEVFISTNAWEFGRKLQAVPVVEVIIPMQSEPNGPLTDVAWFLLNGESVYEEFKRFDRQLALQVLLLLGIAFSVTGGALHWAFRRLARANLLLAERTEDLSRANRDLSQSVRVAALGAVTAHLMHGLRSPVSGLHQFMTERAETGVTDDDAWMEALAATRRMQALIQAVGRVVGEQSSDFSYEVTPREVAGAVMQKTQGQAETRGVQIRIEGDPSGRLENRGAGLLTLLLSNLVENAIEASPEGGTVTLRLTGDATWVFDVIDEGIGLMPEVVRRLFEPQRSTKEGGSGLGLAITRQLALALGGSVRLVTTGVEGTTFRVEMPRIAAGMPLASGAVPTAFKTP